MKPLRLFSSFLLAAAFAAAFLTAARADESTSTLKFSDPSKPGTVKIRLARGDLDVRGTDSPEVVIKCEGNATKKTKRQDGLRVLTAASGFALSEKDNVITVDAMSDGSGANTDFELTVPHNTNLIVSNGWGGDITCAAIAGDVEIKSAYGDIELKDLSGGVLVETMNGEIEAHMRELRDNKPLSFTSTHGDVVIHVPEDAKAHLRLRTQNGAVLTDFDEKALLTTVQSVPSSSSRRGARTIGRSHVLPPEAQEAIREAARVAAQVGQEVAEALREGLEADREKLARTREQMDAERQDDQSRNGPRAPTPPASPAAPKPPTPPAAPKLATMPTLTGGSLVTGTLNGGGPEITAYTVNGEIKLLGHGKK